MKDLRAALGRRYRASAKDARSFAERLLIRAVERFGAQYAEEMAARIQRIFERRDQAARIVDQVIGDPAFSPTEAGHRLQQLFDDIKRDVEGLTDPAEYAKKTPIKPPEDLEIEFNLTADERRRQAAEVRQRQADPASPVRSPALKTGRHVQKLDVLTTQFKQFGKRKRDATRKAAGLAPAELWKAVSSETAGSLEKNIADLKRVGEAKGMTARELGELDGAVRDLSLERARSQRLPDTAEGVLRVEGLKKLDELEKAGKASPGLRKVVEGDRQLELLAAENPQGLNDFFVASGAKSRSALRRYIRRRMVAHIRGLLGEFTAAFQLGDRLIFLKGPDYNVTLPGTDLVGVTRDGRIWLIDNKALSDSELGSVGALMRHLPDNIADDTATFSAQFGQGPDPHIGDAVKRLDKATKDIQRLTNGLTPDQVADRTIQQNIAAICAENGIERVVTNAGGRVEGLSKALKDAEVRLEDLDKPVAEDPSVEGAQ
jgi:hypothetical protein